MIWTKPEMVLLAVDAAERNGLDPAFVCALIEVSTHWNPAACEYNPAPHQKPYDPWNDDWDVFHRESHTYGLMQVQGDETGNLTDAKENVEIGCKKFAKILGSVHRDYQQALRIWWNMKDPPKLQIVLGMAKQYDKFLESRPA